MPVGGSVTRAGSAVELDVSLNTIISRWRLLQDEEPIMMKVSNRDLKLLPRAGTTVNINNYGRVVAYNIADGTDFLNAQALADTQTTFTPSEVQVQVILAGSTLRRVADPSLLKRTADIMDAAMKLKIDTDGTAQIVSFVPIVGAAGTVISPGLLAAALGRARIGNDRTNPEPYDDLNCVLHPLHMLVLAGRLVPYTDVPSGTTAYGANTGAHGGVTVGPGRGGSALADDIIKMGPFAVAQIQGVPIYLDANIAVDANDDASGGLFDRIGMNYIEEVAPIMEPEELDRSMRGAVELNLWSSYVWGLYRASNSGVEILADASLPTS